MRRSGWWRGEDSGTLEGAVEGEEGGERFKQRAECIKARV